MTFIKLADLIINVDYIAAVKFSSYTSLEGGEEIPIVNICLMIPEGSLDDECECCHNQCLTTETLEFEDELAMTVWDYFNRSGDVTVLFE
ncbi:MAG: hypothetical protein WA919_22590 [Coleofasciculaceae cyanobacterium]